MSYKDISNLEGSKLINKTVRLLHSQYIIDQNYKELMVHLQKHVGYASFEEIEGEKLKELFELEKEALRLVHNYASASFSLREHTYEFLRQVNNELLKEHYKKEVSKLTSEEVFIFINDLRRYIQHHKIPFVSTRVVVKFIEEKTGKGVYKKDLLLDKGDLLTWDGWCKKSRLLLERPKELRLDEILKKHKSLIDNLYKNLYEKTGELHKKELDELHEAEKGYVE